MTDPIRLSALDRHFADFVVRIDRTPCPELWWGAALASHAAGRGHSCFHLHDSFDSSQLPSVQPLQPLPDVGNWRMALQKCGTVGAPGAYTPLVLDQAGRLYLHRCWSYERQVADGILSRCRVPVADEAALEAALDRYFPVNGAEVDLQRAAARMTLTHRFSVISGGPGTGKTATVARILALLLDQAGDVRPEIMLAAPTGKAAARLHQSILQAVDRLSLREAIRDGFPCEVRTIHRLLGVRSRGGFRHNPANPLACNILVVDEASMVDLQLMAGLLEALPPAARVILLGDRNQLASVEAGAVLADICDSAGQAAVPVTHLTKSYRFGSDSGIAAVSRLINDGEGSAALELLQSGRFPDISWRTLPSGRAFDEAFAAAVRYGYGAYARAVSPEDALASLNSFRVLSPLRSGPFGIEHLNRQCEASLDPGHNLLHAGSRPRPVMITGNNYELGLFNGDVGVAMELDSVPAVWFEKPEGGLRHISPLRLPPSEAAFALTVHKSQGSEFDRVLLILPDHLSDVLTSELIYTAVTRARSNIEIWGTEVVFRQAVERRTLRTSGLRDKLAAGISHD
jgi:exodeoxyribonuclease V alpha subunit